MLRSVDAAQALADLTEISSQVVQVAIVDEEGAVLASTIDEEDRAKRFVEGVAKLLEAADVARRARGLTGLAQLEAATLEGSIFVVRAGDRTIVATTRPDPTVGLVFYDLKHCLRSVDKQDPKPTPRRKKADASA
jgi:predicted regulator of Ras-like GTPase activity (Roadblock/LC7/MglB family)